MAILVTGGAGYIGSVTVDALRSRGESVVVLDDLVYGHRAALDPDVPCYQGRVGDSDLLRQVAGEHELEACIHFAAFAYVGESVTLPAKYFENNINQGVALMTSLVNLGVRTVVFSSSCATYGEPEETPIHEECRQWPTNPYGWSKLFMERLLASYHTAYGLRFAALRYFNAAGATARLGEHHDPETHLIPNVLSAAMGVQEKVTIFGGDYPTSDGTAVRDFIHVADLADAHVRALDYLRHGGQSEYLNLGTGHGHSVLQVIQCAEKITGRPIRYQLAARRPGDPAKLVADPSRANSVLGWTASRSDLESIVRSAWEWRTQHPQGYADRLVLDLPLFEQIRR